MHSTSVGHLPFQLKLVAVCTAGPPRQVTASVRRHLSSRYWKTLCSRFGHLHCDRNTQRSCPCPSSHVRKSSYVHFNLSDTYHAFCKNNADFLDSSSELILCDAALVLNVEKFKSLLKESCLFLRCRTLLRQLGLQVFLESTDIIDTSRTCQPKGL